MAAKPLLLSAMVLLAAATVPLPTAAAHVCIGQTWECMPCSLNPLHPHVCLEPEVGAAPGNDPVTRALLGVVAA